MKYFLIGFMIAILMAACSEAVAHEMVPTYPTLKPSYIDGVQTTQMKVFNKRKEVEYYEISVLDKDFNTVPFVTSYKIMKIEYLSSVTIDLYIRNVDKDKAMYICSRSKLRKDDSVRTIVSSKICSKIK